MLPVHRVKWKIEKREEFMPGLINDEEPQAIKKPSLFWREGLFSGIRDG
ncbi:hypothetical protein OH491_00895 [Termitidicoccus mucosus]